MKLIGFITTISALIFLTSCSTESDPKKIKYKDNISAETNLQDNPIEPNVFAENTIKEAFNHKKNKDEKALKKCFTEGLKKKKPDFELNNIKHIRVNKVDLETDLKEYETFIESTNIPNIEDLKIYNVEYEIKHKKSSDSKMTFQTESYYLIKDNQGKWKIDNIEK